MERRKSPQRKLSQRTFTSQREMAHKWLKAVTSKVRGLGISFSLSFSYIWLVFSGSTVPDGSVAFLWFYCPLAHLARSGWRGSFTAAGAFISAFVGACCAVFSRVCPTVRLFVSPSAAAVSEMSYFTQTFSSKFFHMWLLRLDITPGKFTVNNSRFIGSLLCLCAYKVRLRIRPIAFNEVLLCVFSARCKQATETTEGIWVILQSHGECLMDSLSVALQNNLAGKQTIFPNELRTIGPLCWAEQQRPHSSLTPSEINPPRIKNNSDQGARASRGGRGPWRDATREAKETNGRNKRPISKGRREEKWRRRKIDGHAGAAEWPSCGLWTHRVQPEDTFFWPMRSTGSEATGWPVTPPHAAPLLRLPILALLDLKRRLDPPLPRTFPDLRSPEAT